MDAIKENRKDIARKIENKKKRSQCFYNHVDECLPNRFFCQNTISTKLTFLHRALFSQMSFPSPPIDNLIFATSG